MAGFAEGRCVPHIRDPPVTSIPGLATNKVARLSGPSKDLARGSSPAWGAPLWRVEERSVQKNGAYWFGSYLPGLPVSETTETSKGERDKSMPGNGSKSGAAVRWRALSKVCMVKAVLPQSQFPVAKGLAVANAAETLRHARWKALPCAIHHQFAWDDLHRRVKETNGTPKHTATPHTRNYGIACSRTACGPVWRRSRHSTQTPGVMAGTATARWTIMRISPACRAESASGRGKDDAANNGICNMRREQLFDGEVLLMQAATIQKRLDSLPTLSRSGKRINGLHRLMRCPHLIERAYDRISLNKGALTPGVDGKTFDGMSLEKLADIAKRVADGTYRFRPVQGCISPRTTARNDHWVSRRWKTGSFRRRSGQSSKRFMNPCSSLSHMGSARGGPVIPH